MSAPDFAVRPARPRDVMAIRRLVDTYTLDGRLLAKATVTLFEDVQEFVVAVDRADQVIGCGALHVMWEDLAEVRTIATDPDHRGQGLGSAILTELVRRARELELRRLFCLTFEVSFFGRHGFVEIDSAPVTQEVFEELLQSYDEGVAEMLDLARVKPNTLGNTRMLLTL